MSTPRALQVDEGDYRAVVVLNGRTRSNVYVYRLDRLDEALESFDINPASPEQRDRAVTRLPEEHRVGVSRLLLRAAERVDAERAKPRSDREEQATPFPPLDPWDEPVDGVTLLDELCRHIERHIVIPSHAVTALALWTCHTYVTDVTDFTPYVLVSSPVRECGKSTLLELLLHLAHRAQLTGGITAAALYRRIDKHAPTMLLDELDTRLRGDGGEALRGVLNTGFHRSGTVTICVGDDHEEKDFSTFCPKVLAGIGRVWDTVTSRSIPIRMARASREQLAGLEKIRGDRIAGICEPYRRRILRWAEDHRDTLRVTDPVTPDLLGARQSDVWRPLLAIADVCGGAWPSLAREAAVALHGVAEEEGDYGLLMLEDVRALFAAQRDHIYGDKLPSSRIVEALVKREDRPWPEYRNDRPITTRGVASLLGRFGIKPKTIRLGLETTKGYEYADCHAAFGTYLRTPPTPAVLSVTSVTPGDSANVTDVTDQSGEAAERSIAAERQRMLEAGCDPAVVDRLVAEALAAGGRNAA